MTCRCDHVMTMSQTTTHHSKLLQLLLQVITTFLGSLLVGSFLNQITEFLNNPGGVVNTLGSSAPQTATFFMTFILVQAFIKQPLQLLRLPGLIFFWLKSRLATTNRQKAALWKDARLQYGRNVCAPSSCLEPSLHTTLHMCVHTRSHTVLHCYVLYLTVIAQHTPEACLVPVVLAEQRQCWQPQGEGEALQVFYAPVMPHRFATAERPHKTLDLHLALPMHSVPECLPCQKHMTQPTVALPICRRLTYHRCCR